MCSAQGRGRQLGRVTAGHRRGAPRMRGARRCSPRSRGHGRAGAGSTAANPPDTSRDAAVCRKREEDPVGGQAALTRPPPSAASGRSARGRTSGPGRPAGPAPQGDVGQTEGAAGAECPAAPGQRVPRPSSRPRASVSALGKRGQLHPHAGRGAALTPSRGRPPCRPHLCDDRRSRPHRGPGGSSVSTAINTSAAAALGGAGEPDMTLPARGPSPRGGRVLPSLPGNRAGPKLAKV